MSTPAVPPVPGVGPSTARRFAPADAGADRLFALARDLLCIVGVDGCFARVNPACERALGWTSAELLARPVLALVHPDDRAATRAAMTELAAGRLPEPEVVEHRHRCRDGSYRLLAWRASTPDELGLAYVVARDVTEERRVEAARHEREALLREEQELAQVGSWSWDARADVVTWSDELYRLQGLAPGAEPASYARFIGLVHPADRARVEADIADAVQTGGAFSHDYRIVRPDGTERTLHCRGRAILGEDGVVARVRGSCQDVTERARAVEALRASEARYAHIAANAPGLVYQFVARPDGSRAFTAASEGARRLFGIDPEALLRDPAVLFDLVHPEDRADFHASGAAAMAALGPWRWEGRAVLPGGEERWVQVASHNQRQPDGSVLADGLLMDVTERQRLEAKLRQVQKLEAVGRLAGGVAHDFNNLLLVIQSYGAFVAAELPEHSPARADQAELLHAATRAQELTRQLLAYGRQQVLTPRRLDVNRKVANVARMLRRVLGEDIDLQVDLADEVWPVHADPGQLEQVLLNLAVNARDAMPDGGILRLRTANVVVDAALAHAHPGLAAGAHVSLVVEDTGTGIDPVVLPHLFEPFITTKGPGKGTGLGLATVHGIVEQSGGHVHVESTPGRGSRFTVLLPRLEEPTPPTTVAVAVAEPTPPRGSETILLVEDEPAVRRAVRRSLARLGYVVLDAASGPEALQLTDASEAPIDLVLTDVVMPGLNGRALVEQLAARRPGLRVLFMSGYTDDEVLRRGIGQAGAAFVQKPFTLADLARAVREALGKGGP